MFIFCHQSGLQQ